MNIAVILTAGSGLRMNSILPKQFIKVQGKEIFIYTLEKFLSCNKIDKCLLVINSCFEEEYKRILEEHNLTSIEICYGGNTRQESSFKALEYLKKLNVSENDVILIHDGARPLIDERIILENIEKCLKAKCAVSTVVKPVDTLINLNNDIIDRNEVLIVQTPQTFCFGDAYSLHLKALEKGLSNLSDDIQIAKMFNLEVVFVEGTRKNIKITTNEDLEILDSYLRK